MGERPSYELPGQGAIERGRDLWGAELACVDAWLEALQVAPATKERYSMQFGHWMERCEERGLSLFGARGSDVAQWRNDMAAQVEAGELSPATVNFRLVAVRSFYRFCEGERVCPDPARGVKGLPFADSGRGFLARDEAQALLGSCDDDAAGLRDRAILSVMVRRGLRCVEVSRADVADIARVAGVRVLKVRGKGRAAKDATVVLGDAVAADLDRWLEARGEELARRAERSLARGRRPAEPDGSLFCSLSNNGLGRRMSVRAIEDVVKKHISAAGLEGSGATAHWLRHTAVTYTMKGGAGLQEAQAFARHADPRTTEVYLHNLEALDGRAGELADGYLDLGIEGHEPSAATGPSDGWRGNGGSRR